MQTGPAGETHHEHGEPGFAADDGWMGSAYVGVIVVEVLVLVALWAVGRYFSSL